MKFVTTVVTHLDRSESISWILWLLIMAWLELCRAVSIVVVFGLSIGPLVFTCYIKCTYGKSCGVDEV